MKKQQRSKKEEKPVLREKELEEFLKNREEDKMIDDHGPVIIGGRHQKPKIPEE